VHIATFAGKTHPGGALGDDQLFRVAAQQLLVIALVVEDDGGFMFIGCDKGDFFNQVICQPDGWGRIQKNCKTDLMA